MSEMFKQYSKGTLEVISGCMFAGKTEELIRRINVLQFAKQKVMVFKPRIDNRYSDTKVASHAGSMVDSILIDKASDIMNYVDETVDVVAIDEVQFLDADVVEVCDILADRGIRVIVAGLDMDFMGRPFGPMPNLMATAEYVTKVHAICKRTGNLANYSRRISASKDLVQLGETESYEAVSRRVFNDEFLNK